MNNKEYYKDYYQRTKHPCPVCGKLVTRTSKACAKHKQSYKGAKAPRWKGGRVYSNGYVYVYTPGHPRTTQIGYVCEHILIWEEAHKRELPKGWIIHHLNGIKDDNRIRNLVALPSKKHYLLLQSKAKRIQELEALLNHQSQLL